MEINSEEEDTSAMDATSSPTKNDEAVTLPGFRFHPTDEELVGFYLRWKVDKKPLKIELIEQVDIYKFDPWDLPKTNIGTGDKERYFFCKRGRKYRNSIRPNRVTGSGFWKATGIDKPVHSNGVDCIGLKKTLVYYRGRAGKGTKTDWMMHEFRLPAAIDNTTSTTNSTTIASTTNKNSTQEAEVWTLCRIFKRNTSYRKYTPDWREMSNRRQSFQDTSSINATSTETYMCFSAPAVLQQYEKKPFVDNYNLIGTRQQQILDHWDLVMSTNSPQPAASSSMASSSSNFPVSPHGNEFFTGGNWDELRSVVDFAFNPSNHM